MIPWNEFENYISQYRAENRRPNFEDVSHAQSYCITAQQLTKGGCYMLPRKKIGEW